MKKGGVLQNTGWLIARSIMRMLVQLIIGAISARYLGPSNYGVLNYVAAYISLFSIICELGLTITIVNEIVKAKVSEGTLVGTAILMRFLAGIISMISLLIITTIVDGNDPVIRGVVIIRAIGLIFDSFNTINFWYQAKLQSKYATIYELVAYIISSIYKVLILIFQKDIFWFAAATSIDSFFIAIFYLLGFKKHSKSKLQFSFREGKRLLLIGLPFIFSGIMVFVYGQTDRIMIGKMLTQTDVGFYSCAASIGTMIGFIPQAIMNSGKTLIMDAKKEKQELFELRMRQTVAAVLWVMNIYAIGIFFFGRIVILVLFGNEYLPALNTLKILIWSFGLSYVGTLRNVWLICEEKRQYATAFSTLGALSNICMNFCLIPLMGINGAALATIITQVVTTFCAPAFFYKTRRFSVLLLEALFLKNIDLSNMITKLKNKVRMKK